MTKRRDRWMEIRWGFLGLLLIFSLPGAYADDFYSNDNKKDIFKGKLFAPNIILEHQDELGLSEEQFAAIKAAVIEVQSNVAGHEWDLREAYVKMLAELDNSPIDENKVLEYVSAALQAENQVKRTQVAMLIKLRNLLSDRQVEILRNLRPQ